MKNRINKDNRERIYKAIRFMETKLKVEGKVKENEKLDLKQIAAESALSEYHFHRLFCLLIGETPFDYLRKRRLYEAALALSTGRIKVIDAAMEFGYSSSDAFSRAFTRFFGFPPKDIKANKNRLLPFPKPQLLLSDVEHIHKGVTMKPKIVSKESFCLVGPVYYGDNKNDEIPAFWQNHFSTVADLPEKEGDECYGFCFHTKEYIENGKFHYMPAVRVKNLVRIPAAAVGKVVPAHLYALFTHKGGAETLKGTYDYIYGTWFPNNKYRKNEEFDFECYRTDQDGNDIIELYVPVIPQKQDDAE